MDDENSRSSAGSAGNGKLSNLKVDRRKVLQGGAAIAGATAFVGPLQAFGKSSGHLSGMPPLGKVPKSANPASGKSGQDAIEPWVDYLQPSSLSKDDQKKELKFFVDKGKQFSGMSINAVSEATGTHKFESNVLAKAFEDLTGIKVKHDLMGEGATVAKMETEMQTQQDLYDIYTIDSDFIGTFPRLQTVHSVTDYMKGEGKDVTLPSLDLDDFMGKDFVTWPGDGKVYQLPQAQFANLYWYRKDWFDRPDLQKKFKKIYGYELNVPVNWSAYEDIADFFTNKVKHIDGQRVYGHMDYGKKGPSIGWRIHDSWLSMAGMSDKGLPFGKPVDDWGIRVNDDNQPVGSMVERGGATNSPAAVYAIEKYVSWLKKYAPPEAAGLTFYSAGPVPAKGHIAQQIFWYSAFASSLTDPSLPVVNDDGTPKWRMAPSPHGPYWEAGMKLGYQDMGSWTLPKFTPKKKMQAAWLYAQFCCCKATSLRKVWSALTPFRDSDVHSDAMQKAKPYLGGLVEFYTSPARKYWTPTGTNVPEYSKLAPIWWKNVAPAVSGSVSPQQAMDNVAEQMDKVMGRLSKAGVFKEAAPKLNKKMSKKHWLQKDGSPKAQLSKDKENPKGKTLPYEKLLKVFSDPSKLS